MLPDPDRLPTGGSQLRLGIAVSFPVLLDLLRPIPCVCLRLKLTMLRATMPEAPVYKHGDLDSGEYDVSLSAKFWQWSSVNKVAKTMSM